MLPGFRFLIATLLLSASVVIFGFGAASLLRATRDDLVASPPTWDAPQAVVARERDTRKATLALLRVEMIADQDSNVEKMAALAAVAPSAADQSTGVMAADVTPGPVTDVERAAVASDHASSTAADGAAMTVAVAEPPASAAPDRSTVVSSDAPQPAKPDLTVTALADPAAASTEVPTRSAVAPAAKSVAKAVSDGKARAAAVKREKARQAAAQRRRVAQHARTMARPLQPQTMPPGNPFAGFGG